MAVLDRLILRMAVCELQRSPDPPPAVVINEALELARTFSTEDSVKFINGMLDGIRKKLSRLTPGMSSQDEQIQQRRTNLEQLARLGVSHVPAAPFERQHTVSRARGGPRRPEP